MNDNNNGVDMADRRKLADRVGTDLKRSEQETGIDWFNRNERITLTTYSVTVVRSVLKHAEARINWVYVADSTELSGRVKNLDAVVDSEATVEGVQATLPVGCLSIKGVARENNRDSQVVSTPEEAREAFTDGGYQLPAVGSRVRDRGTEDGDELVTIATHPDTRAADYMIDAIGATVAEVNREYDRDAPVVKAVYTDEANEQLPWWQSVDELGEAVDAGAINSYSFPADRLASVAEVEQ